MSYSEDEKFAQMIRDYIELGSTVEDYCLLSSSETRLQEIMNEITDAETEIYGKILLYLKDMKPMEKLDNLRKWIVFSLEMDNYEAHLCKTSSTCFKLSKTPQSFPFCPPQASRMFKSEYEYVDVTMKGKRLLVDIDFRTQFELARPTQDYQELTNAIPFLFVGTEEKMKKLITLICRAAKQSLEQMGLEHPPWRKAAHMHSKWFSKNCERVKFSEFDSSQFLSDNGNGNGCFQDFLGAQRLGTFTG